MRFNNEKSIPVVTMGGRIVGVVGDVDFSYDHLSVFLEIDDPTMLACFEDPKICDYLEIRIRGNENME